MNRTKIQWCDFTWSPITGCTPVSEGCANCYSQRILKKFKKPLGVTLHHDRLDEPLKLKKLSKIFVCSMGDLFHEDVPDEFIFDVWLTMARANQHTFLVLTKRPERIKRLFESWICNPPGKPGLNIATGVGVTMAGYSWPLPNVWLGVTAENQKMFNHRKSLLSELRGIKFVSFEPLLGPIKFNTYTLQTDHCFVCEAEDRMGQKRGTQSHPINCNYNRTFIRPPKKYGPAYHGIDWVIVGGETGPGARECREEWVQSIYDQCKVAGVPFFFKQRGNNWKMCEGWNANNIHLRGIDWESYREWPG